jgi:hypothetical protein
MLPLSLSRRNSLPARAGVPGASYHRPVPGRQAAGQDASADKPAFRQQRRRGRVRAMEGRVGAQGWRARRHTPGVAGVDARGWAWYVRARGSVMCLARPSAAPSFPAPSPWFPALPAPLSIQTCVIRRLLCVLFVRAHTRATHAPACWGPCRHFAMVILGCWCRCAGRGSGGGGCLPRNRLVSRERWVTYPAAASVRWRA